jgi:type II secretory pathway component PulF
VADTTAILPLPTRILMAGSDFLRQWWWLLLVAITAAVWTFTRWLATPGGRLKFDTLKLRTPLLGPTLRKIAVGRFARTLGTLSRCGIQILEALHVLRDTLGNEALARTIDEVRRAITQGQSIAEPLRQTGQFPPLFIQVIALGERTGRLDELLLRAADSYEKETTAAVQRTMTVLPALFIVLLAMLVAFILAAVLLPIVNMQMAIPGG